MVTIRQVISKRKKGYTKRLVEGTKLLLQPKKKKRGNMVANDIKTFPNIRSKGSLDIEKIILKSEKSATSPWVRFNICLLKNICAVFLPGHCTALNKYVNTRNILLPPKDETQIQLSGQITASFRVYFLVI